MTVQDTVLKTLFLLGASWSGFLVHLLRQAEASQLDLLASPGAVRWCEAPFETSEGPAIVAMHSAIY